MEELVRLNTIKRCLTNNESENTRRRKYEQYGHGGFEKLLSAPYRVCGQRINFCFHLPYYPAPTKHSV